MTSIYLDNATITKPSKRAIEESLCFHEKYWGSFSAPHDKAKELDPYIKRSYQRIYSLLGASHEAKTIFCSSQAEAINQVIFSTYHDVSRQTGKNQFVTAITDEAPQMMCLSRLEEMGGYARYIEVDSDGIITPEALEDVLNPRTALVSLSWANAMTGVIHPIEELAEVCKRRGVLFHVDASHILGRVYIDLEEINPDFLTFSGQLLHAPKGSGVLYIRSGLESSPFILGGLDQGGLRAGDLDIASLFSLGIACEEAQNSVDFVGMEIARLKQFFEKELNKLEATTVLFDKSLRLPTSTCVAFLGVHQEAMLHHLNSQKLYACFGGGSFQKISLLLQSCGIGPAVAHSALNFTLSKETSPEDISKALEVIKKSLHYFRKLSD